MSSADGFRGLVGGLLLASGLMVALLGGLCTGLLMVPEMIRAWSLDRLSDLRYDWAILSGGGLTMAVGAAMARAGLRRLRG